MRYAIGTMSIGTLMLDVWSMAPKYFGKLRASAGAQRNLYVNSTSRTVASSREERLVRSAATICVIGRRNI